MNQEIEELLNLIQDNMSLQKQKRNLMSKAELESDKYHSELMQVEKTLQELYKELNEKLK